LLLADIFQPAIAAPDLDLVIDDSARSATVVALTDVTLAPI
jgi:CRP-like cAMP-binding protein